jgi:hypothetical protein
LGVNYRTAWHLCHRIREAMKEGTLLSGAVEADETYMSRRKPRCVPAKESFSIVMEKAGNLLQRRTRCSSRLTSRDIRIQRT